MPDITLPPYLQDGPQSPYIARILKHYPDWKQWERENYIGGRNLEGWLYALLNADKTYIKVGFSQNPDERIRLVTLSTKHLPKEMINMPYLWNGEVVKPAHMSEELALHQSWSGWRVKGLAEKVEANNEWYPFDSPVGAWWESQQKPA